MVLIFIPWLLDFTYHGELFRLLFCDTLWVYSSIIHSVRIYIWILSFLKWRNQSISMQLQRHCHMIIGQFRHNGGHVNKHIITTTSNDCLGVSNYRSIEFSFNTLLSLRTDKHQRSVLLSLYEGNTLVPVDSLRNRTITREMNPFDDLMMLNLTELNYINPRVSKCEVNNSTKRRTLIRHNIREAGLAADKCINKIRDTLEGVSR